MKKFLLFMVVALLGSAMWNSAGARYFRGDRVAAKDLKAGDTIALECGTPASNSDYYLGEVAETGALQNVTPYSVRTSWVLVEGPKDVRGLQTFYLQNCSDNKFFGSSTVSPSANGVGSLGMYDNIENAIPFSLHSAADSSEVNEQYGPIWDENSVVFCFMSDNGNWNFLCNCGYWGMSNVWWWGYHDTNAWNVYYVHNEINHQADLLDLINEISESGVEFEGGDKPGQYPKDLVDAYNKALEDGLLISLDPDQPDSVYDNAMNAIRNAREAVEKSYNPIVEGYYYFVSAYPEFYNRQKVEKAWKANSLTQVGWGTLDPKDPSMIFKVTPLSNGHFTIQNYDNGRYVNGSEANAGSQKVLFSAAPGNDQIIKSIGQLQWFISNTFCPISYHPEGHSGGSGNAGDLVTYNSNGVNTNSAWYIRAVEDSIVSQLPAIKEQKARDKELQTLAAEANALWNGITVFTVDTVGLITNATDADEGRQVSSNAKDPSQGTYAALIDNDLSTIFHSTWHAETDPLTAPHNLQFDFSATPTNGFEIRMCQRTDGWGDQDRPTVVNIYASNSADSAAVWTFITQLNLASQWGSAADHKNWVTTPTISLGTNYKYIRMDVIRTAANRMNGGAQYPYFSLSELQVYPVVLDQTNSQYCYTAGLKEPADIMIRLASAAALKYDQSLTTQADIDSLQNAINAVKALYADTTDVVKLIAQLQNYVTTTPVGDGIGNSTQAAIDALQASVNEAKGASFTTPLVKSEVDAALQKLTTAKQTFLATVKMPELNTWYFITSASNTETHYNNGSESNPLPVKNTALYAEGPNQDNNIRYGLLDEEGNANYIYNPRAMWRLVKGGSDGSYYLQCLGTGLYLGDATKDGASVFTSRTPVNYSIELVGNASFALKPAGGVNNDLALVACLTGQHIVAGEADVFGDGAWSFRAVDPNETDMVTVSIFAKNLIDVIAMPFDIDASTIADYNDDTHIYGIRKMTQNEDSTTTVELYEMDYVPAGQSAIIICGNPEDQSEANELILPFPTAVTDRAINGNGIHGMLQGETCAAGTAFSNGSKFVTATSTVGVGANTGVIDASLYTGEVTDQTTALTLTIEGLAWPTTQKGDVNGDGQVNSADVAAIYSYIAQSEQSGIAAESADVNGDGQVNSADVAAIYSQIGGASSKAFVNRLLQLLQK